MTQSRIGTVHLNVADQDKLINFYENTIGLQLHRKDGDIAYMGVGEDDLLALHHTPEYKRYRNARGLYHFALLLPTRHDLALLLQHFAETQTRLQGLSDHIVSEAIYLADPEGNGIEIYADRSRDQWFDANNQMQLATVPLNVGSLMSELDEKASFNGLPQGTIMGHIHLHVSSVEEAEAFYTQKLGMDAMFNLGSATFLSYDGYHHHIGANIWGGRALAPDDALGLRYYVLYADDASLGDPIVDPSNNHIILAQHETVSVD